MSRIDLQSTFFSDARILCCLWSVCLCDELFLILWLRNWMNSSGLLWTMAVRFSDINFRWTSKLYNAYFDSVGNLTRHLISKSFKDNCPLVGPGPIGGMPSLGVFLRNPSPEWTIRGINDDATNVECRRGRVFKVALFIKFSF